MDKSWDDIFDNAMESVIGRVVAVGVAALLPLLGMAAVWLQDVLGVNMNPTEAATFIASVVTGAALLGWQWLRNRGKWEIAIAETHKLYEAGKELAGQSVGQTGGGSVGQVGAQSGVAVPPGEPASVPPGTNVR